MLKTFTVRGSIIKHWIITNVMANNSDEIENMKEDFIERREIKPEDIEIEEKERE